MKAKIRIATLKLSLDKQLINILALIKCQVINQTSYEFNINIWRTASTFYSQYGKSIYKINAAHISIISNKTASTEF